ncbi:MAG: RAMP superfamily CRISPR-associated protein [Candidatus Helarchaeota archaeon]
MKKLNLYFISESISTSTDIYARFNSSKGIQDQKIISSFVKLGRLPSSSIRGWIRHAMEKLLLKHGISICHPLPENVMTAKTNQKRLEADLKLGYHPRASCIKQGGCILYKIFGDLNVPSTLIIPSIYFYPAKNSQFKNHQKIFNIGNGRIELERNSPRARIDGVGTYMTSESPVGIYIESPFTVILRDGCEAYEPILLKTFEFLSEKVLNWEYEFLLGGKRSFGFGRAVIVSLSEKGNFLTKNRNSIGIPIEKSKEIDEKFFELIKKEKEKFPII